MEEVNFYKSVRFKVDGKIKEIVQGIVDEIIVYVTLTEIGFTFTTRIAGNRIYYNFLINGSKNRDYDPHLLTIACHLDKELIYISYDSEKISLECDTNPIVLLNTVKEEIYKLD